ncbi:synaptotagmin-2-like isoform X1 [Clytia hemisphaerica]
MLAILVVVLFLFYKKRKESIEFSIPLEKMTRGLKSSLKRRSTSSKNSKSSNDSIHIKPQGTPILRDTQFWVPEVYNSIIQPSSAAPIRKTSRLQSTLDREIYSKAHDTSYLQAAQPEVFDGKNEKRPSTISMMRRNTSSLKRGDIARRLASEQGSRGMLNFSIQYKQATAKLTIIILKAEGLPVRKDGEFCDPFVDIQVSPYYKRRMHSEVHQKTQNPVFNQSFDSEVPPYEVRGQTIHFTVLDFSQQLAHEPIGSVAFKMDSLDRDAFNAGKEFTLWKKIDKDALESGDRLDGKREYPMEMELDRTAMLLLLSVNYLKIAERLTVTVNKARNLLLVDRKGKLDGMSCIIPPIRTPISKRKKSRKNGKIGEIEHEDLENNNENGKRSVLDHPYVQVTLKHFGRVLKKLRTGVVKHETNPVFNKTLLFDVPKHLVDSVSLTVKLRHHNELGRDRTFAILTVGKNAVGSGSEQWTDMLNSSETVQRWHRLIPIEPVDD